MSTSGISSNSFLDYNNLQNNLRQSQMQFQSLGQDLQSGNTSAAQQDLLTLQQLGPQSSSTSTAASTDPIAQQFTQLSQDLQSGNLSAAQQDYSKIQQDTQSPATQGHAHHHHHGGGGSSDISELFSQLGQDLQSGSVSSAQQAYSTLQQDIQQFGLSTGTSSVSSSSGSNTLSVNA
ncbi:MAG: hypothetical protein WA477_01560 [Candidatus Sulfotelmatobacter sp.]